jgi:hypothetical protein
MFNHPVLFKPKLRRDDFTLKALTADGDAAREEMQAGPPGPAPPEEDVSSPARSAEPLVMLKSIAAAKVAAAHAAARKADAARMTAARVAWDAARVVRAAEDVKSRAEAQLTAAESALETASSAAVIQAAEEEKAEALATLVALSAGRADLGIPLDSFRIFCPIALSNRQRKKLWLIR